MPFSPASIIQYATGTQTNLTGAQFDFTATLSQAAEISNSLFLFQAITPTNAVISNYPGEAWNYDQYQGYSGAPGVDKPQAIIGSKFMTLASRSSFPFRVQANSLSIPTVVAWMIVEVQGCEPFWPGNPWQDDDNYPQLTYTGTVANNDFSGT